MGRDNEVAIVADVIARAQTGTSGALLIHGDAGVGKTALVDHALATTASSPKTKRIVATEAELELPYAGLHQLCRPMLTGLDRLPQPQAAALEIALGLQAGTRAPSRFLVGLGVLGLLAEAAGRQPLVCVFDDAQWLDAASRSAIAFAARRLAQESVVFIVVTRERDDEFRGLPELELEGLGPDVARRLLQRVLPVPLDPRVRGQLIAEARGNPLALMELPRTLDARDTAGGYAITDALPLSRKIEASMATALSTLTPEARQLLLIAAADPTGDTATLWRARQQLGIGVDAVDAIERSGMLSLGTRASFSHPLARSTVYRAATAQERRTAHTVLAEATGPGDPDRQAWHAAYGAGSADESTAAALERSASRARARGGETAAAAFLERAAELSPSPQAGARRLLAAAQARVNAGDPAGAQRLLGTIAEAELTSHGRAHAALLRATIDHALTRDQVHAHAIAAAGRELLEHDLDAALAALEDATYIGLFSAGFAGRAGAQECPGRTGTDYAAIGTSILAALPAEDHVDGPFAFRIRQLRGHALRATGQRREANAIFARVATDLQRTPDDVLRVRSGLSSASAFDSWDIAAIRALLDRQVDLARDDGDLFGLPNALSLAGVLRILDGQLGASEAIADEIEQLDVALQHRFPKYCRMMAAAWRGDLEGLERWSADVCAGALERGDGSALSTSNYAWAILANGLGRYSDAVVAGVEELPHIRELTYSARIACELVEAASRTGKTAIAERALADLEWLTSGATSDWAMGVLAEARALLAAPDDAEALHREAVERFAGANLPLEQARAHLTYGEWLRRRRRRADARESLLAAHAAFVACGAHAFAARAARELEAAGVSTPTHGPAVATNLTSQELAVAHLAAGGQTNREIAATLFISARTVEYHLRKAFQKLGVTSRHQLADALPLR